METVRSEAAKVACRAALVGLLVLGCAVERPEIQDPVVLHEWGIAQARLIEAGVPVERSEGIAPEVFQWRNTNGTFECNGVEANGCYEATERRITWNTGTPEVIRHEAGHAILHVLGYGCWRSWEHGSGRCP